MKLKAATIVFGVGVLILSFLIPNLSPAQTGAATLSGKVTDSSGRIVLHAKISIQNIETGQSTETQTNSAGLYSVPNLAPGDYTVSASAEGFAAKVANVTLTGVKGRMLDLALSAVPSQREIPAGKPPATPPANPPNAPSSTETAPSLNDLGFPSAQVQGSAQEQALLNERTHMLKVHQTLGLITAVPMLATVISGGGAKAKKSKVPGSAITEPSPANLDLHVALGGLTTGLYFATAYYAIRAPKVPGVRTRGAIRLHKDLEWIHGPGMILTPILGIMAYDQENQGQRVHGIASAHSTVAYVTAAAYGASIVSVSWPIHLKFWR